jgi:pyruvate kinase
MITHARPTRAEASDVANAIYDGTSAVMLSGETAAGKYPIQAVRVMKALAVETELDFQYYDFFQKHTPQRNLHEIPSSVSHATIKTTYGIDATAIFAFTTSGFTARLLSSCRPKVPIIAMTSKPKVYYQLALMWGVIPLLSEQVQSIEEAYKVIRDYALEQKIVCRGDLVVITAGNPFGRAGTTNMMIVETI